MTAERSFLLDELGDPAAPIGSKLWSLYVSNEIRKAFYDSQQSGTRLRRMVDLFKEHSGWQPLGFFTWEQFCQDKLQKQVEEVEVTVKVRGNGGDRRSDTFQFDNCQTENASEKGGNDPAYWKARITRDFPDQVNEVGKGKKYKSWHAAAISLGIKKDDKCYQLSTDPDAAGRYLAKHVDKAWMVDMYEAYVKEKEAAK